MTRRTDAPPLPPSAVARGAALAGAALATAALIAIWWARFDLDRHVYVSQLGAPSMPTATTFNGALLAIGVGGLLVAVGCRGLRSTARILDAWSISWTLAVTGSAFAVASRIPCTDGCPVPFTPGSTVQDLVHVSFAGVGFAAAAWAMLQVGTAPIHRALRTWSLLAAASTGVVSAGGAVLSILGRHTDIGALLEFIAMTAAVTWLVAFSSWSAVRPEAIPRYVEAVPEGMHTDRSRSHHTEESPCPSN